MISSLSLNEDSTRKQEIHRTGHLKTLTGWKNQPFQDNNGKDEEEKGREAKRERERNGGKRTSERQRKREGLFHYGGTKKQKNELTHTLTVQFRQQTPTKDTQVKGD